MRALELHACAKAIQRSAGRSSVAAAAYRAAMKLVDERTGLIHDYTRKGGVEDQAIFVPEGAPSWAQDREKLWNAAEAKENRKNSCTARELEIGLPHEFSREQRREVSEAIASELVSRYGCAVDVCHHAPSAQGDERNHHVHMMFTDRGFDGDEWARKKYRDLNNDGITVEGQRSTRGKEEVKSLREFIANTMNRIAEREGIALKVEHLSFKERGIDREPSQHLGPTATDMERSDKATDRGDQNREIALANADRAERHREALQTVIEKTRFENWVSEKRAEMHSHQMHDAIELDRRHDREKDGLEERFEASYGAHERTIAKEIECVSERLSKGGAVGLMRRIIGANRRDQHALGLLQATAENVEERKGELRGQLDERQKGELKRFHERSTDRERDFDRWVERVRSKRREQEQERREAREPKLREPDQRRASGMSPFDSLRGRDPTRGAQSALNAAYEASREGREGQGAQDRGASNDRDRDPTAKQRDPREP